MFILGHLGIGKKIAAPWLRGLRLPFFFLGAILPDLVDKPLYYGLVWTTGRFGRDLGLISSTRTFGHTGLFLLALLAISWGLKSKKWFAVSLGVATHLLLDSVIDQFGDRLPEASASIALLFPFKGWRFPIGEYRGLRDHALSLLRPQVWISEIIGFLFLSWDFWKEENFHDILENFRSKKLKWRKRRYWRREN